MILAVGLPALPLDFAAALQVAVELGFTHVEVAAREERPADELDALADSGLFVAAADLGRDLPPGIGPTAADPAARREAVERIGRQIADAGRLGATHAVLALGPGGATAEQVGEVLGLLADVASRRMIRLCVATAVTDAVASGLVRVFWPADASWLAPLRQARFDGVVSLWAGNPDALREGKRRLDSLIGM
jgi:sugar phosphate isomerase/epimerase